ncbi:MAG: 3-deoxy-manno-octulosonate cytidylyltransferase [Alcaligenaceae bacterium]|nr:3-deoxy-manno-octulosonate cytidylyltransferase [Alcaligenaceae bacterium]
MTTGFTAIIPARRSSTRLPDKPLLDINGYPMVVHTARQAARSGAVRVVVATDDTEIAQVVNRFGIESILTRADHPTGTDRLAETAERLKLSPEAIVVNVQGDEPLIEPDLINEVARLLADHPQAHIATCASPITDAETLFNPNAVKVVCDTRQRALYFSRAPIPWARDTLAKNPNSLAHGLPALHHIGLYAYRTSFLQAFARLEPTPLEQTEALEQLRALEKGYCILVHTTDTRPQPGVDTPEDLARVRAFMTNRL